MSDPDSKSGVFSLSSKNKFASGSDSKSILRLAKHVFAINSNNYKSKFLS
jgi:hypothetical protein